MRFLNRGKDGRLAVTDDLVDQAEWPTYAVLSHTWLADSSEEVSYNDVKSGTAWQKTKGFTKLRFCVDRATQDGIHYVWIDTCCIDRSSAPELQEALVSMFAWYRKAVRCYAYLADVSTTADSSIESWQLAFRKSRWFTRSWTLQELLAPRSVDFFSREGIRLGDKKTLQECIHEITEIPIAALQGEDLSTFSVSRRLSWARHRKARRKEDRAYSLLGIFGIFMTLIYGEGDHAFVRLRAKINDPQQVKDVKGFDHLLATLPLHPSAAFDSWNPQHETKCLPGTRVEVLEEVKLWANGCDDKLIYWLNGVAGSGKTTIARTIAKHYQDRGLLGGSFFFSKEGGASHGDKFVTTLAAQLVKCVPDITEHICNAIRQNEDIATRAHGDQWTELIMKPLAEWRGTSPESPIIFVVDALDECESNLIVREFLRLLAKDRHLTSSRVRIFVTSRPLQHIGNAFSRIPDTARHECVLHNIQSDLVRRDLAIYFRSRFRTISLDRGMPSSWPSDEQISCLVNSSNCLFVWAATACGYIDTKGQAVDERLRRLVDGQHTDTDPGTALDKINVKILQDAIHSGPDDDEAAVIYSRLRKILGTLFVLRTPLSLEALATLLDMPSIMVEETVEPLSAIIAMYMSKEGKRTLRLSQPSFRGFLFDATRCTDSRFWVDEKKAHEAVARHCLRLMSTILGQNLCKLSPPQILRQDVEQALLERCLPPELRYACRYWVEHYRRGRIHVRDDDETHRFYLSHFVHWLEALSLMGESSEMATITRTYQSLLNPADNPKQVHFVKDARRLIVAFQSRIDRSPLQVYSSALLYLKHSNVLRIHFWDQINPLLKTVVIVQANSREAKDAYNFVNDLAFTPDGAQLVSGSIDERVRIWNVADEIPHTPLKGQSDKISTVVISPDGKWLASGSDDGTIWLWELKTNHCHRVLKGHTGWVNAVAFASNGTLLASGSMDESVLLWDTTSTDLPKKLEFAGSGVNDVSFSADGSLLASANVANSIVLWDVATRRLRVVLEGHDGPINAVRFLPYSNRLVSGSDDMIIRFWDVTAGTEVKKIAGHTRKILAIACSHDGKTVASASEDKTARVWNAHTGEPVFKLDDHTSGVNAVVYSPDSKLIATCSADDEVRLWNARSGSMLNRLPDFEGIMMNGESPTRTRALSNGRLDNAAFVGKPSGHTSKVTALAYSPGGRLVVSGSLDATLKVWTKEGIERCMLIGHAAEVMHAAFSPQGHQIASASTDKTARLWDPVTGSLVHKLEGHTKTVNIVRFSPNGQFLASCSADGTVRLWSTVTGLAIGTLRGHSETHPVNDVAFSPDSKQIVSCSSDMTICFWDVRTARTLWADGLRAHDDSVTSVTFSLGGKRIASCSLDRTVKIWDIAGNLQHTLEDHTAPTLAAAFSQNGKQLVSSAEDGTIRVWDIDTEFEQCVKLMAAPVRALAFLPSGDVVQTDRGLVCIYPTPLSPMPASREPLVTQDWTKCDQALMPQGDYEVYTNVLYDSVSFEEHDTGSKGSSETAREKPKIVDLKLSDVAKRSYCSHCHTPLTMQYISQPDRLHICVGSIDTNGVANEDVKKALVPTQNIFVSQKPSWVKVENRLPTFDRFDGGFEDFIEGRPGSTA
ncbi:hypothetical protein B0A48_10010 [Cryoendolithus antarcticus]|uniref:Mitochondrial division protein 1 n=1 Tax=Cryoendolithus antarcticus TaxID=1507870 RepID=A0A1V8T3N6_9PEZI|nr:hypothetical protein B0A48_10010 [Cryoendolithus antarcticus]